MNSTTKSIKANAIYRTILFSGIAVLAFSFSSCDNKRLDGDWDDNIFLSTKTVNFTANEDSTIVTTKGTWWWINGVSVNGTYYHPSEDVNIESDHYSIAEDCFVVERRDSKTLFIKATANTTGAARTIRVGLEAGDYFDAVTVTQAAK